MTSLDSGRGIGKAPFLSSDSSLLQSSRRSGAAGAGPLGNDAARNGFVDLPREWGYYFYCKE